MRVHHTSKQVRARYGGISDMTLYRWLKNPNIGFPKPLPPVVGKKGRRLWDEEKLDEWDRKRATKNSEMA